VYLYICAHIIAKKINILTHISVNRFVRSFALAEPIDTPLSAQQYANAIIYCVYYSASLLKRHHPEENEEIEENRRK
jgi:hypothetical protein